MDRKNIVVLIHHAPFAGNYCTEGLRTIVGTEQAIDGQSVKSVFLGDGVYFGLKDVANDERIRKFTKTFTGMGMKVYIEEESLVKKSLSSEHISKDFQVLSRTDILKILKEADHVLSF
jgi:sulfur relay (sulfurtransferase) DsrF/TusC family protein